MSKNFVFNSNSVITMSREKNNVSYGKTMSANLGTLYPCYFEEVLPGDTFKVKSQIISRVTSSFIKPAFANIFLDVWTFFVPSRLCYDRWKEIFGENPNGFWTNNADVVTVPTTPINEQHQVSSRSVANYLGLPVQPVSNANQKDVSLLPFRAFALIYNEWFRNQNYIDPVAVSTGEAHSLSNEYINDEEWSTTNYTGRCPKIGKMHDMFSSVLPSPQKGQAVDVIPGVDSSAFLPLQVGTSQADLNGVVKFNNLNYPRFLRVASDGVLDASGASHSLSSGSLVGGRTVDFKNGTSGTIPDSDKQIPISGVDGVQITSTNLGIENPVSGSLTVNDLRLAFQTQRILERDSRSGSRYIEYIKAAFGVSSPDARLQRPELLSSKRLSIGISQVAQTTGSADKTLGSLAGYSLNKGSEGFSKAFVEHGYIISCLAFRQFHTYQSGIEQRFTRKSRFDFYDPALAYIGEQPCYKREIFADVPDDEIFGYLPAWTSYRYHNNEISGQMCSNAQDSLDVWHIADEYANAPTANAQFMNETPQFLDRVLSVSSDVQDQFILDIWHDVETVRVMPSNPSPGLIDHH